MPWAFRIDTDRGLAEIRFSGDLSPDEVYAAFQELAERPDFRPEMSVLSDHTAAVGTTDWSAEAVRFLARRLPLFEGRARRAFVMETKVGFGLARMFELVRERHRSAAIRVFRDAAEARGWLLGRDE